MDADFWLHKWQSNDIAFHRKEANPLLVKHFAELNLAKSARVFLPLCGKTRDIAWLLSQGYKVVGAELSELAIQQLFVELNAQPNITSFDHGKLYQAPQLDIFVGDIFKLSAEILGSVDAIYDRAALVALPFDMRIQYSKHLQQITKTAPQLLICYDYDQTQTEGPPFSISDAEVAEHYQQNYEVKLIERVEVSGGLRGVSATEKVWTLIEK